MAYSKKRRILLVDDEERLLRSLSRRLAALEPQWEVLTAISGPAGLALLAQEPIDLVVSDLQMPGMDGATFLGIVRERHPNILRFALSGHAQSDMMLKAIALSHQYFSKPCDTQMLAQTIEGALENSESIGTQQLRQIVVHLNQFPSAPAIYTELLRALSDSQRSVDKLTDIISRDPALASKILHVANSSFFGSPHKVREIHEAVMLLGTEAVRSIALMFKFVNETKRWENFVVSQESLWSHSIRVAGIASMLCEHYFRKPALKDAAQTIGLLHDLGKVILADFDPKSYAQVMAQSLAQKEPISRLEEAQFGISHAAVSGLLFELWGLPPEVCTPIRYHLAPNSCMEERHVHLLAALHLAEVLDNDLFPQTEFYPTPLESEFLKKMNMPGTLSEWKSWMEGLRPPA